MSNPQEQDLYGHEFLLDHLNPNIENNLGQQNINNMDSHMDLESMDAQHMDRHVDGQHLRSAHMSSFTFDSMDFAGNLAHGSEAFPPSEYPQNTPALAARSGSSPTDAKPAKNGALSLPSFQSPILPSQNKKSYNHEHLYQKKKQQRSRPNSSVIASQKSSLSGNYTPLVSPAATPLDQSNGPYIQADFEPLTSPALKAQNQSGGYDRHRPSSAFAGDDYANGTAKRRTPHSTPNLQANASKLKSTPSQRKAPFEPLPDSSLDTKYEDSAPMLPPSGKPAVIDTSASSGASANAPASGSAASNTAASNSSASATSGQNFHDSGYGPGTLMGFTMNRLAEQQSSFPEPTNPPYPPKAPKPYRSDSTSSQRATEMRPNPEYTPSHGYSSSETSPVLDAQGGYTGHRRDRPSRKDTSHKFSEQGRRNRMNQAVYDLSSLIPREYHEQVAIPSKAATLELAATYIRHLLQELEEAKEGK